MSPVLRVLDAAGGGACGSGSRAQHQPAGRVGRRQGHARPKTRSTPFPPGPSHLATCPVFARGLLEVWIARLLIHGTPHSSLGAGRPFRCASRPVDGRRRRCLRPRRARLSGHCRGQHGRRGLPSQVCAGGRGAAVPSAGKALSVLCRVICSFIAGLATLQSFCCLVACCWGQAAAALLSGARRSCMRIKLSA